MRSLIVDPADRLARPGRAAWRLPWRGAPRKKSGRRGFAPAFRFVGQGVFRRVAALAVVAGLAGVIAFPGVLLRALAGVLEPVGVAAATVMEKYGLSVASIEVVGSARTGREELLAAIGVSPGQPILLVDLDGLRRRVEALAWVESATVARLLPGVLRVSINERQPFALWQRDGRTVLIDKSGAVIAGADPSQHARLPRVVGPGAAPLAAELVASLAVEPDLFRRVDNAILVRGRRWDVELADGVVVRLPEDGKRQAWLKLAALEREQGVLGWDIVAVDLRDPDRVVVRFNAPVPGTIPGAARKAVGKET
jgi:cell division protein FtsQ